MLDLAFTENFGNFTKQCEKLKPGNQCITAKDVQYGGDKPQAH